MSDFPPLDPNLDPLSQKKQRYLVIKQLFIKTLDDIAMILEVSNDKPVQGKNRDDLFSMWHSIDHTLLSKFDAASFEYFEAVMHNEEPKKPN